MTVVAPNPRLIGQAAANAALEKVRDHEEPTKSKQHAFIPFAMETNGFMHSGCRLLAGTLANSMPKHLRHAFLRDFMGSAATALARFRAAAVIGALREDTAFFLARRGDPVGR